MTSLRSLGRQRLLLALMGCGGLMHAAPVLAQSETLLIQPALPDDFDRGRNVSVTQRTRPDYDPIGVRAGSFNIFPEVNLATGYSDNIYYDSSNRTGDGFVSVSPRLRVQSDWSRNGFVLTADSTAERYFSHPLRNQTPWGVRALGFVEAGNFRFTPEAQISRQYESPISGQTLSSQAALSNYLRKYAGFRTEYAAGQTKITVAVDDANYAFNTIEAQSGQRINQRDRDRNIARVIAQGQYAFTPSVSTYVQGEWTRTVYDVPLLTGNPNRDSNGYRIIGGFNFDLAGLMRGTIGAGYIRRDFDASQIYKASSGLSVEAKIEYFPTELTTFTLNLRRVIEDSNISSTSAFFDNRVRLAVDHELRRNILLGAYGEYAKQDYIHSSSSVDVYRVGTTGQYLVNNWLRFNFNLGYTGRSSSAVAGRKFDEVRGLIGVTLMR